jgi:hypothetical protein
MGGNSVTSIILSGGSWIIVTVASPIRNVLTTSYAEAAIAITNNVDKMIMRFILHRIKEGGRKPPHKRYLYLQSVW